MKRHLEPLAIAANITQASFCRLDEVLLTFGYLVMQYQKMQTDADDAAACASIIASIEKLLRLIQRSNVKPKCGNNTFLCVLSFA